MSPRRLSETAVTPSDRSIEKATVSEYDGSLPTSVMSVPCSVVMTCGTHVGGGVQQDLLRQIGRGRVRHRVVRVDDVQAVLARDFDDAVGERERSAARGTADTPACGRGGTTGRAELAESERRIGADHVHVVAALRERLGQLGRDDPLPPTDA